MTLREALTLGIRRLTEAGIEGAARDARALLAETVGIDASRVTLEGDMVLTRPEAFDAMIVRRISGEPVSKILGRRQFWGREFAVTRDTLDPRPETETLIAAALELGPVETIADLGTGSGIIAVTLLAEWPGARATATDISEAAMDVALSNAGTLGVRRRMTSILSDGVWFPEGIGAFEMILSNPPYITEDEMAELSREVREHDPEIALTPGGDGLDPYREIAGGVRDHLVSGGHVLVEIGWKQGPDVAALFEDVGLEEVRVLSDLDGRDRVVVGRNP